MPCVWNLQQDSNSSPQNAPRLRRIVGHPVLLQLVLEYSLAMVDCHRQPYQGVFASTRFALLEFSVEELDSNNCTTSVGTVSLVCASSGLCCVGFHMMLGFGCATPTPPELLLPPSLDDVKTSSSFPSSVMWAKQWIVQHSNSSIKLPLGG